MFNKKIALFFIVLIGICHISYSVVNPDGHDYKIYSRNMESRTVNDLPGAWLIMKLFTNIFGNPRGLYLLSAFTCLTLYLIFAFKIKTLDMLILFSLCFFSLYPIWYLSSGVLRNLMGLCWLSWFILHCKEKDSFFEPFILSVTHTPTLIIYILYKISKKEIRPVIYSVLSYASMIGFGSIFKGMIWASTLKPLRMIYIKIVNPFYYVPFVFQGNNVRLYSFIVFTFCCYTYYKFFKTFNRDLIFWLLMLIMPFIPIYAYNVQIRFLLFTILPVFMVILYQHEKENKYQKIFLGLIAMVSITVRIMGLF